MASPNRLASVWSSDGFGRVEACCERRDVADWTLPVSDLDVSSFRVRCCSRVFWGEKYSSTGAVYRDDPSRNQGCDGSRHHVGIYLGSDIYCWRNLSESQRQGDGTWKQAARRRRLGGQRTKFFPAKLRSMPWSGRRWGRGSPEPSEAPN